MESASAPPARSTVFFAHDDRAIQSFEENPQIIRKLVDDLVCAVTGQREVVSAWKILVNPTDLVGIKISATGGRYFSTHRSVVEAIASGLQQAGVPGKNIVVWDRADMADAGYRSGADYQVRTIEPVTGYDAGAIYQSPLLGKLIWGDILFFSRAQDARSKFLRESDQLSDESRWSKVLSRVTKIIDVPVMSAAEDCGLAGCLYNLTIPNVDNWRRFTAAPNFGDPYLCELYADAHVAPKVVLHIMDGLIAQYAGGPEFRPNYAFHHRTIYASNDPVALDATALREIEKWRAQSQLRPIGTRADYLKTAEMMRLGNFAPERIELKKIE